MINFGRCSFFLFSILFCFILFYLLAVTSIFFVSDLQILSFSRRGSKNKFLPSYFLDNALLRKTIMLLCARQSNYNDGLFSLQALLQNRSLGDKMKPNQSCSSQILGINPNYNTTRTRSNQSKLQFASVCILVHVRKSKAHLFFNYRFYIKKRG